MGTAGIGVFRFWTVALKFESGVALQALNHGLDRTAQAGNLTQVVIR